ncbi:phosphoadenosine phosphosulfate reductase family protein (plasmid) [Halobacillus litoralis]|uniref:phosphoadenosine phosphosulfate reductase domain-containing protein n=1 Tax=Halobacillus litoralis TaxID=45668 RepID=UPI001CFE5D96|nr:phosphoadenosine phosphosulfate reductase family protein [Halobacillus litoralis]WLR49570.1 phosphoadenosine phosphosulfate reductase family protein [Halobacillus litoralis]
MSLVEEKKDWKVLKAEAMAHLHRLYFDETDDRPWAVAWSGGKDSTTVLGLIVEFLESLPPERRHREVYAVMSDTKMENPNLEAYMHNQVSLLNDYAEKKELPIQADLVFRKEEHDFFYLVMGRGYFLPQRIGRGRWCTQRLKLFPQNERLKEIQPSHMLVGTRLDESQTRRESMEKWSADDEFNARMGEHAQISTITTFMPIANWSVEDVWAYLTLNGLGWSSSVEVRTLYKDATGECGFSNPKGVEKNTVEACGARFGCWTCPVVMKDQSTEKMSETYEWMQPLAEWRKLQLMVFGDYIPKRPEGMTKKERGTQLRKWEAIMADVKLITKSGHKRNGNIMKDKHTGEHRLDQGTITVEARKYLFDKLMETEQLVNRMRELENLPPLELVREETKELIKEQWEHDEKEAPWLVSNESGRSIKELDEILDM